MIETEIDQSKRIIRHVARDTVDRDDLVAAIEVTSTAVIGCLWDFRDTQFAISLHVVHSPSYRELFPEFDKSLQGKRTAYVVNSELHRLMIQTFAEEVMPYFADGKREEAGHAPTADA